MKPKDIRNQVRNVAKEMLPELLGQELVIKQYEELVKKLNAKLAEVEKQVKDTMHEMNTRHKDTLGMLVRQSTINSLTPPTNKE